jgi:hypothetical protein
MQSLYIARQALHLVILLNDSVDAEEGPDDMQQAERVDLEEWVMMYTPGSEWLTNGIIVGSDLIELLEAMEEWGAVPAGVHLDHNQALLKIQHHHAQIFKERFYFVSSLAYQFSLSRNNHYSMTFVILRASYIRNLSLMTRER